MRLFRSPRSTMEHVRTAGGIVLGYVVYAVGSMLLVGPVVSSSTTVGVVVAAIGLPIIGFTAGNVTALVAAGRRTLSGYLVAALVLLATLVNIIQNLGAEPIWYKIGTIVLVIPAVLFATRRRAGQQASPEDTA